MSKIGYSSLNLYLYIQSIMTEEQENEGGINIYEEIN